MARSPGRFGWAPGGAAGKLETGAAFHTLPGIFVHQRTNYFGLFGFPRLPSRAKHLNSSVAAFPAEFCSSGRA